MSHTQRLNSLLKGAADLLDLPASLRTRAINEYEALGEWFAQQDALAGRSEPSVYPQGSMRLGTVVRPANSEEEYDIDLVYLRPLKKESTTQEALKKDTKESIESYIDQLDKDEDETPSLKEGRRCLTLTFASSFHLDVLPAIPDTAPESSKSAILITDTEYKNWDFSDPVGFAAWFDGKAQDERLALKRRLSESVESVPDSDVKTHLQLAVQLLKRHRDIHFESDDDLKPISIIITTLAARAYRFEESAYETLLGITSRLASSVTKENGVYQVLNPVNDSENFADKWEETPDLAKTFFGWAKDVYSDLLTLEQPVERRLEDRLAELFGSDLVEEVSQGLQEAGELSLRAASEAVPGLKSTSHRKPTPWVVRKSKKVSIRATVHQDLNSKEKLWDLTSRAVFKGLCLKFEARTNAREPYEVFWQVTNTGREARDNEQLRGEFTRGKSQPTGRIHKEVTSYRGTHEVQAFVVQDDCVIAKSHIVKVRIM